MQSGKWNNAYVATYYQSSSITIKPFDDGLAFPGAGILHTIKQCKAIQMLLSEPKLVPRPPAKYRTASEIYFIPLREFLSWETAVHLWCSTFSQSTTGSAVELGSPASEHKTMPLFISRPCELPLFLFLKFRCICRTVHLDTPSPEKRDRGYLVISQSSRDAHLWLLKIITQKSITYISLPFGFMDSRGFFLHMSTVSFVFC